MARETIIIGNHQFKTQKELKEFTKGILEALKGKFIQDGPKFNFLSELVKRHPDKTFTNIKSFSYGKNDWNDYTLYARCDEGDHVDISWNKCIAPNRKGKNLLIDAFRHVVSGDVKKFKDENFKEGDACPLCSKSMEGKLAHVDHYPISFKEIVEEILPYEQWPNEFDDHPTLHRAVFKKEHQKFADTFYIHHSNIAQYRIICSSCNSSLGSKNDNL